MNGDVLAKRLNRELREGLGCTEPASIGFACASASKLIDGDVKSIDMTINLGLFKNAYSVLIPNVGRYGIGLAASIGAILRNPEKKLVLFEDVDDEVLRKADELLERENVNVEVKYTNRFYIDARVSGDNEWGEVIVLDNHTNLVKAIKNGEVMFDSNYEKEEEKKEDLSSYLVGDIVEALNNMDFHDILFVKDAVDMNMKLVEKGMNEKKGLGVGYGMHILVDKGFLPNNLVSKVCYSVSSASDARMGGLGTSAMTLMGSGNQGIAAIVPVAVVGKEIDAPEEKIIKAVALSCLITIYIKEWSGRLSPLCGAAIAGAGASAGITWLLGGDKKAVEGAIKNMCGDVMGVVCDGAKEGCSLKLRSCAESAMISSYLALQNIVISSKDGIISEKVEDTIRNVGKMSSEGMTNIDGTIVKIIQKK